MEEKYKKAKELFDKYHNVKLFPSNIKKEFDKYNVPNEIVDKWEQDFVDELYTNVLNYIESKPNIKYLGEDYSREIRIYICNTIQNNDSYRKIIYLFNKLHALNLLSPEIRATERPEVFLKRLLLCDKSKLMSHEFRGIIYHSNHRFCGLLERFYSEGLIDLFNSLMDMLCDCIKHDGILFQYFIQYLLDYMEYINNTYYFNKIKECIEENKKKNMTLYDYTWNM